MDGGGFKIGQAGDSSTPKYCALAYASYLYGMAQQASRRVPIMRGHDALPLPLRQATLPSLRFGHPKGRSPYKKLFFFNRRRLGHHLGA